MAKDLIFSIRDNQYAFSPVKIERKKLYGWTETLALDEDGNECKLVSMDESGTAIIPKGCLGLGMLNQNFEWVEKSELKVVDENGNDVDSLPSSFSSPIELNRTVTEEELLDYSIVSVYQLEGESPDLINMLQGTIYTFPFNYRDGYESRPAFLIESDGKLFILVGVPIEFSYIGLEEPVEIDNEDEEEFSEELGIDFSMM
ncbi:MAG: hypothetical protein N2645_05585 [Clostridia bacterium]|nr:hypothetical protein [Clostridia bacterium]